MDPLKPPLQNLLLNLKYSYQSLLHSHCTLHKLKNDGEPVYPTILIRKSFIELTKTKVSGSK